MQTQAASEVEKVVNAGRDGMYIPAIGAFVIVRKSAFRLVLESVARCTLPSGWRSLVLSDG